MDEEERKGCRKKEAKRARFFFSPDKVAKRKGGGRKGLLPFFLFSSRPLSQPTRKWRISCLQGGKKEEEKGERSRR